jgi:hypothetical protein
MDPEDIRNDDDIKSRRVVGEREILDEADANPDPISGAPGAHPIGVGVGAAGAGAAGAAIGAVAGPIGSAIGAVVGAVAGGLAGKGVAESVNPTVEEEHWRETYASRPYVEEGSSYDTYGPAYQYGWESRARYFGRDFDEVEPELRRDWEAQHARGERSLEWDRAKHATRDAWERLKERGRSDDEQRDLHRVPR